MDFFSIPPQGAQRIAALIELDRARSNRERTAIIAVLKAQGDEVIAEAADDESTPFYALQPQDGEVVHMPYRQCAHCEGIFPLTLFITRRGKEHPYCAPCRHTFYQESETVRANIWEHLKTRSYEDLVTTGELPAPIPKMSCPRCQQEVPYPLQANYGGFCSADCQKATSAPRVPCANPACTTGQGVLLSRSKHGFRYCSKACRDVCRIPAATHSCANPACSRQAHKKQKYCSMACFLAVERPAKEKRPCANPACPHARQVQAPQLYCCQSCVTAHRMAQGYYKAMSEQGVEKLFAYQQANPEGLPFKYEQRWQAISAANKNAPPRLKVRRTGEIYGRPAIFEPDGQGGYACHIEGDMTVVYAGTKKQGLQLLRQAVMNGLIDLINVIR